MLQSPASALPVSLRQFFLQLQLSPAIPVISHRLHLSPAIPVIPHRLHLSPADRLWSVPLHPDFLQHPLYLFQMFQCCCPGLLRTFPCPAVYFQRLHGSYLPNLHQNSRFRQKRFPAPVPVYFLNLFQFQDYSCLRNSCHSQNQCLSQNYCLFQIRCRTDFRIQILFGNQFPNRFHPRNFRCYFLSYLRPQNFRRHFLSCPCSQNSHCYFPNCFRSQNRCFRNCFLQMSCLCFHWNFLQLRFLQKCLRPQSFRHRWSCLRFQKRRPRRILLRPNCHRPQSFRRQNLRCLRPQHPDCFHSRNLQCRRPHKKPMSL